MREGQFTACATCALALHLLDTEIYNQKSVLQFLPTSQVQYDRKQGLCKQVSARCCDSVIYHRKRMFRRVHQPPTSYNLQWKVKILVHANLSNAESYINK